EVQLYLVAQQREPAEPQAQVLARREVEMRTHLQRLDVDLRLEKPVEQHEAVDLFALEPAGKMRDRRVERRKLDRNGNADGTAHRASDLDHALLELRTGHAALRGEEIGVQLDRVGAGLFEQLRVGEP